jgi:superfamily II DNA or RNA helicase
MSIRKPTELQNDAISHINNSFEKKINPVCALDMGLGKTFVACKIIERIITKNPGSRVLIIHRASNYESPWKNELQINGLIRYQEKENTGFSNHAHIHGKNRWNERNRKIIASPGSIITTSYETAWINIENGRYTSIKDFDLIIFDELHTIINSKKITKKYTALQNIKSPQKLALTGTPIQNDKAELGLIYIFLNSVEKMNVIINILNDEMDDEDSLTKTVRKKKAALREIMESSLSEYIDHNGLFYHYEEKTGFEKNAFIFSLPVDKDAYSFAKTNFPPASPKRLMYLSHPASVFDINHKNQKHPPCLKAEAVKIILENTLEDEKTIIFSRYIDVLDCYFEMLRTMNIKAFKITGADKGKKLDEKITLFRHSEQFSVLLTTIQKASEGFNFEFATNIIILEYWWNPQKLFQAMSRIDRKNQTRNIFIYILCYNFNHEIIWEEKCILDNMKNKVDSANKIYETAHILGERSVNFQSRELPKIITFSDGPILLSSFSSYVNGMHRQNPAEKQIVQKYDGINISEARKNIEDFAGGYLQIRNYLLNFPWRMSSEYLRSFYEHILIDKSKALSELIVKRMNPLQKPHKYSTSYPFIFIRPAAISVQDKKALVFFVAGKNSGGKYELLSLHINKFNIETVLSDLKSKMIKEILNIIIFPQQLYSIFYRDAEGIVKKYYSAARPAMCLTSIFTRMHPEDLFENEIFFLERILLQESRKYAEEYIQKIPDDLSGFGRKILTDIKRLIPHYSIFYNYPLEKRSIICTTNIIQHIGMIISILRKGETFPDEDYALNYISAAAQVVFENGAEIIPNWKQLTMPII